MNNLFDINDRHLKDLENESIFIMREVAAQFEKKVILFSGGKDSIVVVHLAKKSFLACPNAFQSHAHRHWSQFRRNDQIQR
jgi:3'-phosphoadenosine 5'-phosphosulfate sulfotransferase (PAPS reductase)/FAD synthetase